MRVVGGSFRGRPLSGFKGGAIRPTSDRVREAIFNVLCSRGFFVFQPRVLDLYAGTGALGIEALSRGAERAVFVDSGAQAAGLIKKNIDALGLGERALFIRKEVNSAIEGLEKKGFLYDIIFLDPPYGAGLISAALAGAGPLLTPDGIVVAEGPKGAVIDADKSGLIILKEKSYGDTVVFYFGKSEGGNEVFQA